MSDSIFRSSAPEISTPQVKLPDPKPNLVGAQDDAGLEDPLEGEATQAAVLNTLGIDDMVQNLSSEDADNLNEVTGYIKGILSSKGVTPTQSTIQRTFENLKYEMGLDPDAEPSVMLDRIGGVVKAWRNLSFINDPREKRSMFMKLARAQSSSEMNKMVFAEMNKREVWQ